MLYVAFDDPRRKDLLEIRITGAPAGSGYRACDSRSLGCGFKSHAGYRDYLKENLKKKKNPDLFFGARRDLSSKQEISLLKKEHV